MAPDRDHGSGCTRSLDLTVNSVVTLSQRGHHLNPNASRLLQGRLGEPRVAVDDRLIGAQILPLAVEGIHNADPNLILPVFALDENEVWLSVDSAAYLHVHVSSAIWPVGGARSFLEGQVTT